MNDQQQPYDPYDPYYTQPQLVGYDEYGQPVYQQPQQHQQHPQQSHQEQQQYPQQQGQQAPQGYGYDPYAQGPHQSQQPQQPPSQGQYDPYAQQQGYGYDGYGYDTARQQAYEAGRQPPVAVDTTQQWNIPQQQTAQSAAPGQHAQSAVPGQRRPEAQETREEAREDQESPGAEEPEGTRDRDYRTEQFSFIEEPDEDSEDVIDWLKFTESRSERREEARRRGRNRVVALIVVLALAVVGGAGYLWYAGKLPGLSTTEKARGTATGPQKRDVIVVHLHNTKQKGTSTALLVDNSTTGRGTTLLLPNSLAVANDDGEPTTLGKSVDEDGSDGTREAVGTLLGTEISGTWRLDTPYLDNLVELVGTIDLTTDTEVPAEKKGESPVVRKGQDQTLSGRMAVAYATYRGPGEPESKQLQRFGQVLQGVLRKMSDDPQAATVTVETLAQILDPSLPEKDLGASLAKLAEHAKVGDYSTKVLPVETDGTLSEQTADTVVKDVLGGSVSAPEKGSAVRVGVKNASGNQDAAESARISLVNGGYGFVDAGTGLAQTSSQVSYGDDADKPQAVEVAKTLGLPTSAVKKGAPAPNADVSVVLGGDYKIDVE
ncbi:LCP family protein [Streptomyces lushanensis]|uniref:LCP family protein n=1 Tax=Streptomyces lushanensis TaxID=1434255 RepID=UPI000836F4D8|nr:LCP family protein [Streptomyces lushanensis]